MSLEDRLKVNNFNAKKWLEKELSSLNEEQIKQLDTYDINSGEEYNQQSIDMQLTEILFNVKYLQQKCQDDLLNAQEKVQKNQENILQKQEEVVNLLGEIEGFLQNNSQADKMIKTNLNNVVFDEIYEMIQLKSRLNHNLEIFDVVLQLDSHQKEIQGFIEEGNIQELTNKCMSLNETIQILLKLPKLNPNYEKAETILNMVINYIKDLLHLALLSEEKTAEKVQKYYEILHILKQQEVFDEVVSQHKLSQKQKDEIKSVLEQFLPQQNNKKQ
ncbi:hypothetical protein ABPG72_000855 [Tetrahymena utriculariae]